MNGSYGWHSTPFVQDSLWTDGTTQYGAWVDIDQHPIVGKRTLPDGAWSTFDLSTVTDNPLASPMDADEHNVLSVGVDDAGHIHVAGNMHSDPLRYVVSDNPDDITAWSEGAMVGTVESQVTYPRFVRRSDGTLLFFYRDGTANNGDTYLNVYDSTAGSWSRVGQLLDGKSNSENGYLHHIAVDSAGTIHVFVVWRVASGAESNEDICYLKSADGGVTWTKADGTAYTLPVTHTAIEVAVDVATGSGLLNAGGADADSDGNPHGVFLLYDVDGNTQYHHVWHDGTSWHNDRVTSFGLRMETVGVGTIDGSIARAAVAVDASDRVWIVYRADVEGRYPAVWALNPSTGTEHKLIDAMLYQWEPAYDSQALRIRDELHMLVVPSIKYGNPDLAGETGYVSVTDLSALAS